MDEVESRGWGRRAPQSPSSSSFGAPQGNNKIYRSDEVFLIEETNENDTSQTRPTETRTIQSRTQSTQSSRRSGDDRSAPEYSYLNWYKPRQPTSTPPQRIPPRGEEVESRGWRRGAPQSPSPLSSGAPQGNNKIYTYNVVFFTGETNTNPISQP